MFGGYEGGLNGLGWREGHGTGLPGQASNDWVGIEPGTEVK